MSLLSIIIERLTFINEKLNEISNNSKRVDELPVYTNGNKLIAVFNQSNNKTEKQSLTDLLANISDQNNINIVYEISTSSLSTNNISGVLEYINNLPNPGLQIISTQSSVKYKIIETLDIYEIVGVGKGTYGIGFGQLTLNNLLLINTYLKKPFFTTIGTTTLTANSINISTGFDWIINAQNYANILEQNIAIPFSATGTQRIDIFVATTNNDFIRVAGVESINPIQPATPENTLFLTFVLVAETAIEEPPLPDFGALYIEKEEKKEVNVNVNDIFSVRSKSSSFLFGNNVLQCSGLNFTSNILYYDGKKYSFKNTSTANIILKNRILVNGNVRFVFPNELDFILKPGEIVEFILRTRKFLFLEYVGKIQVQETLIKNILGNVTIDASFNNTIALQKANATITLPTGLGATFDFVIRRFSATTTTFVAGAGATISSQGDGTSFTGKGMISVFCDGANNFIIAGQ